MVVRSRGKMVSPLLEKIRNAENKINTMSEGAKKRNAIAKLNKLKAEAKKLRELSENPLKLKEAGMEELQGPFTREELSRLLNIIEKGKKKKLE